MNTRAPSTERGADRNHTGAKSDRRQLWSCVGQLRHSVQQVLDPCNVDSGRAVATQQCRGGPQLSDHFRGIHGCQWWYAVDRSPSNSLGMPSRPSETIGPNAASSRLVMISATPGGAMA